MAVELRFREMCLFVLFLRFSGHHQVSLSRNVLLFCDFGLGPRPQERVGPGPFGEEKLGQWKKEKGKGRKEVGGVWVKSSKKSGSEIVSKAHLFENWAGQRQGSRQGEEPALRLKISFLKHFSWRWHFCNLLFMLRKCTTLNCKSSSSCFRD